MMPFYPGLDLDRTLVILDWSGWVRRAWHASGLQVDKTAGIVAGWLARLLSDPMPNMLVAACDPPRRRHTGFRVPTWRHYATKNLPEDQQYKAGRVPATPELMAAEEALDHLLQLHSIPMLAPHDPTMEQNWEADDAAATAVRLATREGRNCVLVTIDKDWHQLVNTTDPTMPMVICWDPLDDIIVDEKHVLSKWSVEPNRLGDLLALTGDKSDNIRNVRGIGKKTAADLLWTFGSLEDILKASTDPTQRAVNKWLQKIHEHEDLVRFGRSLVQLWNEAPIDWDPPSQWVGGFDVRGLRKLYRDFGHTILAESIPSFPKRKLTEITF